MGVEFLLEEKLSSYYWAGFIIADGYISKLYRLTVRLAKKDIDHVKLLARLCDKTITENYNSCGFSIMSTKIISQFVTKFNLILPKTYNCPTINIKDQNKLLAFLIGFIDGDGCIDYQTGRTHPKLRIKLHSCWLDFLHLYKQFCPSCKIKINNQGYGELCLTKVSEIIWLKNKVIKFKLPALQRKWDKIDISFVSMYDKAKKNRQKVFKLYQQGKKQTEIAKMLNLSDSYISQIINKGKMSEVAL